MAVPRPHHCGLSARGCGSSHAAACEREHPSERAQQLRWSRRKGGWPRRRTASSCGARVSGLRSGEPDTSSELQCCRNQRRAVTSLCRLWQAGSHKSGRQRRPASLMLAAAGHAARSLPHVLRRFSCTMRPTLAPKRAPRALGTAAGAVRSRLLPLKSSGAWNTRHCSLLPLLMEDAAFAVPMRHLLMQPPRPAPGFRRWSAMRCARSRCWLEADSCLVLCFPSTIGVLRDRIVGGGGEHDDGGGGAYSSSPHLSGISPLLRVRQASYVLYSVSVYIAATS